VVSTIAKVGVLAVVVIIAAVYKVRDLRGVVMLAMATLASGLWLFGHRQPVADAARPSLPRLKSADDYIWLLFAIMALLLLVTD
jgi:hypothetical protein